MQLVAVRGVKVLHCPGLDAWASTPNLKRITYMIVKLMTEVCLTYCMYRQVHLHSDGESAGNNLDKAWTGDTSS